MGRWGMMLICCGVLASCAQQVDQPTLAQETTYDDRLPPMGKPVEYFLYTHCGLRPIHLDGRWWHPFEVLAGDEEALGDYERGTLTVVSESKAVFESDDIEFEFEPGGKPSTLCR